MKLTRTQLDRAHCANCGCGEEHGGLFLHGKCHLGAGNDVEYNHGVLYIRCHRCERDIAAIAVKEE